jgi:ferritin-like metal-binding protein YciE
MATQRKSTRSRQKQAPDGRELLVLELQEIHSAESQLSRVLPRLMKAVQSDELREHIEERLSQGERLLQEIESCLEEMDETPGRKKNVAAEGLINDAREHVQEIEAGPALDAVLLAAIQKTEHYCIAAWGTAKSLATSCEEDEVVTAMDRALKEGKSVDEQLTQLAERRINPQLMQGGAAASSDEDEDESEAVSDGGKRPGKESRREHRPSR